MEAHIHTDGTHHDGDGDVRFLDPFMVAAIDIERLDTLIGRLERAIEELFAVEGRISTLVEHAA